MTPEHCAYKRCHERVTIERFVTFNGESVALLLCAWHARALANAVVF